jgi:RNA polymerase sigma-70 factor (ECF subfamily)
MMFESTMWTVVRNARAGGEAAASALVARYRDPVLRFIRRAGFSEADADDLSQEVFVRVFSDRVIDKADPARGRFRSLLLAVTRNVILHHREREGAEKRGAGRVVPLDADAIVASRDRDADFDREWVSHLIQAAVERLRRENANYFAALRLSLFELKSHKEIAAAMHKTEDEVRNYVSRGRARLVENLHAEIREYSSSGDEFEDEVKYLAQYLKD